MEHNINIIYLLLITANCFAKEMTSSGDASSRLPIDSILGLTSSTLSNMASDDVIPDGLVSSSLISNDSEVELAAVETLLYLYRAVFTPFVSEDSGQFGGVFGNYGNCPNDKKYDGASKKCNHVAATAPPPPEYEWRATETKCSFHVGCKEIEELYTMYEGFTVEVPLPPEQTRSHEENKQWNQ